MTQPTIVIFTVVEIENAAVICMLEEPKDEVVEPERRQYTRGTIPAQGGGKHHVAVQVLSSYNNTQCAISATEAVADFPGVQLLVFCGIAGAIPSPTDATKHVRLGDIVTTGPGGVVQHDFKKKRPDGEDDEYLSLPRAPADELVLAAKRLTVSEMLGAPSWQRTIARGSQLRGVERPPPDTDVLYDAENRRVAHPEDSARSEGQPRVFSGIIASGNSVVKDEAERELIRKNCKALAIEMEGSGLADAAHRAGRGYYVVRGTCDYSNQRKNKTWQGYAALVAAAYLRELLGEIPPHGPSTTSSQTPPDALRAVNAPPPTNDSTLGSVDFLFQRVLNCVIGNRHTMAVYFAISFVLTVLGCVVGWSINVDAPTPKQFVLGSAVGLVPSIMYIMSYGKGTLVYTRFRAGTALTQRASAYGEPSDFPFAVVAECKLFAERCLKDCRHG